MQPEMLRLKRKQGLLGSSCRKLSEPKFTWPCDGWLQGADVKCQEKNTVWDKSNAQSRVRSMDIWPEEEMLASSRQGQDNLGFSSRGRKEKPQRGGSRLGRISGARQGGESWGLSNVTAVLSTSGMQCGFKASIYSTSISMLSDCSQAAGQGVQLCPRGKRGLLQG